MRRGGHKLIFCGCWWPPSVSSRAGNRMIVRMSMSGCPGLQLRWAPKKLIECIVEEWEPVYLRPPNDEEVEGMLERNAARNALAASIAVTRSEPRARRGLLGSTRSERSGAPLSWTRFVMRTFKSCISLSGRRRASMTSTCCASHCCILMCWRVCGRRSHSLSVFMVVHVVCCIILLTVFFPSTHLLFLRSPTPSHPEKTFSTGSRKRCAKMSSGCTGF